MTLRSFQNLVASPACGVTFTKIFGEEVFLIWFDFGMCSEVPFSGLPFLRPKPPAFLGRLPGDFGGIVKNLLYPLHALLSQARKWNDPQTITCLSSLVK